MKRILLATTAIGLIAWGTSLQAEGRIRQRQENQQQRIGSGVQNGSLNAREAARLERREAGLNREIRRDHADGGGLSPAERVKIEHQQDRLSRGIYRQKHDAQTQH